MQTMKKRRSVTALLLTLSLLIGMLSVVGAFPTLTADGETPTKFTANFAHLREYLTAQGITQNDYLTAYTPVSDTTSVDGYLNTWMRERFASIANSSSSNTAVSATRAWFSQGNYLLTGADTQTGNSRLAIAGGSLHYKLVDAQYATTAPVMMRRTDTLIPQYDGVDVRLKNFEASLDFIMQSDNRRGGMVFNFHESDAGKIVSQGWNLNSHTGNTLVIGNGAGYSSSVVGGEGWVFYAYDPTNTATQTFSATTIDETIINSGETKATGGVRFGSTYTAGTRYVLTVKVLNGTAVFTITNKSTGEIAATLTKAYTTTDGYVSFGFANRNIYLYNFEITELDDAGNAVDYGTYHDTYSKADGDAVDVFRANFSDMADAHWNGSAYKNDSTNAVYSTTADTATVTLAGDAATYTFDANDKALVAYLQEKFDFYHSAPNGTLYTMSAPYVSSEDLFADVSGYVANWNLKDNRWLYTTYGTASDNLFRKTMSIVPKLNGTPIHARDFAAEFDIAVSQTNSRSAVAFSFRSAEPGRVSNKSDYSGSEYTDTAVLVFNRFYMGIYDQEVTDFTLSGFHSNYDAAWQNKPAIGAIADAHVSVKVVGDKMTLKVTSLDGASVYYPETTTTLERNEGGYLYFSTLNYDAGVSNIQISVLEADGLPAPEGITGGLFSITGFDAETDYEYKRTTDEEWTAVPANATVLNNLAAGEYRVRFPAYGYYAASEAVTVTVRDVNLDTDTDGVSRFEADFATLTGIVGVENITDGSYRPSESDTAVNDYMNSKFGMFYNNQGTLVTRSQAGLSSNPNLESDAYYDSYWRIGSDGTLIRYNEKVDPNGTYGDTLASKPEVGNEMLRKNEVLTVKAPSGKFANLKNFKAEYLVHDEEHKRGAVTLAFRSDTAGKVVNGYGKMYANQQYVIIGTDGSGNVGISVAGEMDQTDGTGHYFAAATSVDALNGVTEYKVTVAAVGETLKVKITSPDGAVVYYPETAFTLTRTDGGYLSLALSNSTKALKYLAVTRLDDSGEAIDFANTVLPEPSETTKINVETEEGYELKAGSLIAVDTDGATYVPQRVGFREGGDASQYTVTAGSTLTYAFMKPTLETPNIGNVGYSYNSDLQGLRFVSRFTRKIVDGENSLVFGTDTYAVKDYGMLLAAAPGLAAGNGEADMLVDTTNPYVQKLSVQTANKHYDLCTDYIDMSVCVVNIDNLAGYTLAEAYALELYARPYVVIDLGDGTEKVLYGEVFSSTYGEVTGATTEVYLSDNGSDDNAGTAEAPVATLTKAVSLVVDGGTIRIPDTYTAADQNLPASQVNKTVIVTGGVFDASNNDKYLRCGVTFDDVTVKFGDNYSLYANGNPLTVNENVTVTGTLGNVFGGYSSYEGTDSYVKLLSGDYKRIYGGGTRAGLTGTATLYIGGNVNAGFSSDFEDHAVGYVYGGSMISGNVANTDITITGNARVFSVYGGGRYYDASNSSTVTNAKVTMLGGTAEQLFGGGELASMTGSTEVNLLGGTVVRRIYGGCYNDDEGVTNCVNGNTTVRIASGFVFECAGTSSGYAANEGIRAGSRLKANSADETSTLVFDSAATKTAYQNANKLGQSGDASFVNLAFGCYPADNTDTVLVDATQF